MLFVIGFFMFTNMSCHSPLSTYITGYVFDDNTNLPLSQVTLSFIDDSGNVIAFSTTNKIGKYSTQNIPVGEYLVFAEADGYRREIYDDVDAYYRTPEERIKRVSVEKGGTLKGINFRLKPLASISGHVYVEGKIPIVGATMYVFGPHWTLNSPIKVITSADGSYEVTGLNSGVSIIACAANGYVTQYYSGTYIQKDSEKVLTNFGETTTDINFYLVKGGAISGSIFEPDGNTLTKQINSGDNRTETKVYYYQVSGIKTPLEIGTDETRFRHIATVDSNSNYFIGNLLTGTYDIVSLTRSEKGVLSSTHNRVDVVTGQETRNIDLVSLPGGSLSGHVYMEDGETPISDAGIKVFIELGNHDEEPKYEAGGIRTNNDGSFRIELLPPGKVYINISGGLSYKDSEYVVQINSEQECILDAVLTKPEYTNFGH